MGRESQLRGSTNPLLSQFATGYKNSGHIHPLVAPSVNVLKDTGTFYVMGKEGFFIYDTKRALRAEAKKVFSELSNDTYACVEHALEHPLDYEEIEIAKRYGAAKVLDLKKRCGMIVSGALSIAKEKAVADILFSDTYYASGNKVTLTGTEQWDQKSTSDPITDINTGKEAARDDIGRMPNTLVFGHDAWETFRNHPNVIAKIKNSKNAFVTIDDAKEILDVENIIVGDSVYSTDAGVFTDLWADNVAIIYLPKQGELAEGVPIHTVSFDLVGFPLVREYANKKTLDIEETQKYHIKNISTSNGYLITDVKS